MDVLITQMLILLFLFSITLLYYYWKISSKSATTIPPSPPKLAIIGHLHLLTDMPHHTFAQLADKLGPFFYLQLGRVPTFVISSPQLAKLVLKTHDQVFASRPQLLGAQYLSFGFSDVTFSCGPYWRQARKLCVTELLGSKRVNSFLVVRDNEVNRFLNSVKTQCGRETDMSKLFFTLANDILCLAAFGKRYMEGSDDGRKSNLANAFTEGEELLSGFCVGEFFPEWSWLHTLSGYTRRFPFSNSSSLSSSLTTFSHLLTGLGCFSLNLDGLGSDGVNRLVLPHGRVDLSDLSIGPFTKKLQVELTMMGPYGVNHGTARDSKSLPSPP